MRRLLPLGFVLMLLAACATEHAQPVSQAPQGTPPPPTGAVLPDWRAVARPPELGRLDGLKEAWAQGLKEARASGHGADLVQLGELVDPSAAADGDRPRPGDYRCRTVKLGAKSGHGLTFVAYGWFQCRIEVTPKGLKFYKVSGSQRPAGL